MDSDAYFYAGLAGGRQKQINRLSGDLAHTHAVLSDWQAAYQALQKVDRQSRYIETYYCAETGYTTALKRRLQAMGIDPKTIEDENGFWDEVAEEAEGLRSRQEQKLARPFAVLAMTDEYYDFRDGIIREGAPLRQGNQPYFDEQQRQHEAARKRAEERRKQARGGWFGLALIVLVIVIGICLWWLRHS